MSALNVVASTVYLIVMRVPAIRGNSTPGSIPVTTRHSCVPTTVHLRRETVLMWSVMLLLLLPGVTCSPMRREPRHPPHSLLW